MLYCRVFIFLFTKLNMWHNILYDGIVNKRIGWRRCEKQCLFYRCFQESEVEPAATNSFSVTAKRAQTKIFHIATAISSSLSVEQYQLHFIVHKSTSATKTQACLSLPTLLLNRPVLMMYGPPKIFLGLKLMLYRNLLQFFSETLVLSSFLSVKHTSVF